MVRILANILSLIQHQQLTKEDKSKYRLENCLCCGKAKPHLHGGYPRKADRSTNSSESLNPIIIQRYYCPDCRRTCSILPECIPPRRWYLWEIQQIALMLLISGKSLRAVANVVIPSRRTIGRWINCFKEQFHFHKDVLCNHITELGRTIGFADFWQACLGHFSLAQAMRLCYVAGVPVS
jgi:transposase-like protein